LPESFEHAVNPPGNSVSRAIILNLPSGLPILPSTAAEFQAQKKTFYVMVLQLNHNNMRTKIKLATLLLVATSASAQKQSVPAKPGSSRSTAKAGVGTTHPNFLTVPLDINTTNLGPSFAGHDVVGIYTVLKKTPSLAPKGEYETTAQFEQRNSEIARKPILGSIAPNDYFAFVISRERVQGSWPLKLTYDADLRLLQTDFTGEYSDFALDADKARRTTILMREVESDSSARQRASDSYSISLAKDWLFQPERSHLSFSHLIDLAPEEAKSYKDELQALMVCRLAPPWTRRNVFGHGTVSSGGLFNANYLEVVLEQLWLYNSRTGEVLEKITEESLSKNKNQQLALKVRQTPLILELSATNFSSAFLTVDGVPRGSDTFNKEHPLTVTAKREIEIMISSPKLSELAFQLNGQPYSPQWKKVSHFVGRQEFVESATAIITAPAK
jgi:hypothetical protein